MDVEVPTARGHLPKDKKDSETEDLDDRSTMGISSGDDDGMGVPVSPHHHSYTSKGIWREVWENTTPLTLWCYTAALVVVVGVLVRKGFSFFFVHAFFMTLAYVGFASEAMLVYRPFDTLHLNVRSPNQRIQRNIHKVMNHAAGTCTLVGLVGILVHRVSLGKSVVPHGWHSWCGTLVIVLVLVQIGSGHKKLKLLQFQGQRSLKWHGHLGLTTYTVAIATVILGLVHIDKSTSVYIWIAAVLSSVVPVAYAYTCIAKHAGYSVVDQL
ncbi:hypothetical protein DYB37_004065 [Aphanomyces astaci]|uniref:Cytochrome b561 domain-containing protein n=2 Tax=Aphanomyces astaci TaxID=112090 RepID=A0A397D2A0_APHAT|nr:hypothetical protein DYB25_006481 [Aphanomyces astaci]RHY57437.1 hypothetical protein DYB38_005540 [Aphanomyces astaci]RHY60279.1 hypothetical protein DYB34_002492 [Aphanomyces astaci]RHY62259.1 hypothetical protein DYB30_001724 [Aphanomyces astaci]RHY85663.1 hypothetical protein DYB35_006048 [Aphanomyces astaci]